MHAYLVSRLKLCMNSKQVFWRDTHLKSAKLYRSKALNLKPLDPTHLSPKPVMQDGNTC